MFHKHALPAVALALVCRLALAGDLVLGHAHARATVHSQPSGVVYLNIENHGKAADQLLAAASPVAKSAQIHTMTMDGNMMRMREVGALELAPGAKIAMVPGNGYHIMLMGLKQRLKAGDTFPLTLTFAHAGRVKVGVHVDDDGAQHRTAAKAPL